MEPLWNFAWGPNGPPKIQELVMYFNGWTLQILLRALGNSNGVRVRTLNKKCLPRALSISSALAMEIHGLQSCSKQSMWQWLIDIFRSKTVMVEYCILYCQMTYTNLSSTLTHLSLDKMATISQTIFSTAFSLLKTCDFLLKFHLSLFIRVQIAVTQHWFR